MKAMRAVTGVFVAIATVGAAVGGCSFDDSAAPAAPYNGPDATVDSAVGEAGGGDAVGALCDTYGGAPGVKGIADSIVTNVMGDCRIGGFFAGLSSTDAAHFKECFEVYMQSLLGCAGISYTGAKDLSGQACRDMKTAHQNLAATDSDFLAFMNDVITALQAAKMTQADQNTVISALNGVQGVHDNKTGNYQCTCAGNAGCVDAGIDAGTDAATEAGTDAGTDAHPGTDSGADTGVIDSGGGSDTGAPVDSGGASDGGAD